MRVALLLLLLARPPAVEGAETNGNQTNSSHLLHFRELEKNAKATGCLFVCKLIK